MVKVGFVSGKQYNHPKTAVPAMGFCRFYSLRHLLVYPLVYSLKPLEMVPLSGVMMGQSQIDFWQIKVDGFSDPEFHGNQEGLLWENQLLWRQFARKIQRQHISVCGGQGWNYHLQQTLQHYESETLFTGGFSLGLYFLFDFLLQRAHLWRGKDIVVLNADNPLGRFTSLALAQEARLLLLTGRDKGALELLSEEVFYKTGLAVRIVSEEKARQWGKMFFCTGEERTTPYPGVVWDMAAMAGLRSFSPGKKTDCRLLYPAYHKEKYLPLGWASAALLGQREEKLRKDWKGLRPSEKLSHWSGYLPYFPIKPVFFLEKENGNYFFQLFGREHLS